MPLPGESAASPPLPTIEPFGPLPSAAQPDLTDPPPAPRAKTGLAESIVLVA